MRRSSLQAAGSSTDERQPVAGKGKDWQYPGRARRSLSDQMSSDGDLWLGDSESSDEEVEHFVPGDLQQCLLCGTPKLHMSDFMDSVAAAADGFAKTTPMMERESEEWSFRLSDVLPPRLKARLDKNAAANAHVFLPRFELRERIQVFALQQMALESLNHVLQFAGANPESTFDQAFGVARLKGLISKKEYKFYLNLRDKSDKGKPRLRQGLQTMKSLRYSQDPDEPYRWFLTSAEDQDESSSSSARRRPDLEFNVIVDNWLRLSRALLVDVYVKESEHANDCAIPMLLTSMGEG